MVNLNVRLDEFEHQKLVEACTGLGCDKSTLVREALRIYLGGEEPASLETPRMQPETAPAPLRNIRNAVGNRAADNINYQIPKLTTRKVRYDNGVVEYFDEGGRLKQRHTPKEDGSYRVQIFC